MPAPVSGGSPLAGDREDFEAWLTQVDKGYPPADQPASDWPRLKDIEDRRRDQADVRAWYASHDAD
jgi:hypothetical protein